MAETDVSPHLSDEEVNTQAVAEARKLLRIIEDAERQGIPTPIFGYEFKVRLPSRMPADARDLNFDQQVSINQPGIPDEEKVRRLARLTVLHELGVPIVNIGDFNTVGWQDTPVSEGESTVVRRIRSGAPNHKNIYVIRIDKKVRRNMREVAEHLQHVPVPELAKMQAG